MRPRPARIMLIRAAPKGSKIFASQQKTARIVHQVHRQLSPHVGGISRVKRRRGLLVPDRVTIGTAQRAETRMKAVRDFRNPPYRHATGQDSVQGSHPHLWRQGGVCAEVDYLTTGMNSCIGTTGPVDHNFAARDTLYSLFQSSLDGGATLLGLPLEAVIVGAVVFNATCEFHLLRFRVCLPGTSPGRATSFLYTSAICTICAASPCRRPSLVIRV